VDRPQREYPRFAHEAAIAFHVEGVRHEGRTTNVSRGGLCADLADPVAVGTDLEVDIQLVFDEGTTSEPLRVPARVVWCTAMDDAHQVGMAFRPLDPELAQYLTMFLRYLQDGTPPGPRDRTKPPIDERFG
jgi:hypothetical protein